MISKKKLDALDMLKTKKTQAKVSKDLDVRESTLHGCIKDEKIRPATTFFD